MSCECCDHAKPSKKNHRLKIRLGAGALLFAAGLLLEQNLLPSPDWPLGIIICLAAYLITGYDVLIRSARNIARGQVFDENFLMSISTIGAFCIGEYPEAAAVMLFYQLGEALEAAAAGASRASIQRLMDIRPDYANLVTQDGITRVSPADVHIGDYILVKPGERIPLDGIVTEGSASLDLSALTGESMPKDTGVNDEVLSGAINKTGALTIKVTKSAGDSTVSKILKLVEESAEKKSHVENFITTFARYYTPAVVFAAVLVAVLPPVIPGNFEFKTWIYNALVFLVVSCPCALVISVPLSFFAAIGAASRSGILVKGSNYLSALARVDTVIFDKTGTLTQGKFRVSAIYAQPPYDNAALLRYAAGAETYSNHPAASAIQQEYQQTQAAEPPPPPSATLIAEHAGLGVEALVDGEKVYAGNAKLMAQQNIEWQHYNEAGTAVYLAIAGKYAGAVIIQDEIKPGAKPAVTDLRKLGVKEIAMFTGDTKKEAERIAEETGISTVHSDLLPHQKAEELEKIIKAKTNKGSVVFVGDGINDAPSLAISDIGIAIGSTGSDAAIEAADIVLMTGEPQKISQALRIARKTRRIVAENITLALGVKAIILILGIFGLARIWAAVFGDVGVALLATLNALRSARHSTGGKS